MRYLTPVFLLATVICMAGCQTTKVRTPAAFDEKVVKNRIGKLEGLANTYDKAIEDKDLVKAKYSRNELVYGSLQLIDASYNTFEGSLFEGRAWENFGGDFIELATSAATGITNGARVKSILAISLTGFKGLRKSVDVNFFRERTTEVLALKMRASRAKILQVIQRGLGLDVDQYPLGAAIDDLTNYIYAGSLNSALIELAQDTGAEAKQARIDAANLKIIPFLTKAEIDEFTLITVARESLVSKLSSSDSKVRDQAQKDLAAAVGQLYEAKELEGKKPADLLDMLQAKIEEAREKKDEALRKKILKALNIKQ